MNAVRRIVSRVAIALSLGAAMPVGAQLSDDEAANSLSGQPSLTLAPAAAAGAGGNAFIIAAGPANGLGYAMAGAMCHGQGLGPWGRVHKQTERRQADCDTVRRTVSFFNAACSFEPKSRVHRAQRHQS